MLFLFRKLRRKLLSGESKVLSYLLYAIGEIILVVIGILIAVAIDDWNTNRTYRIKEKAVIENLHHEFMKNQQSLDSAITRHQKIQKSIAKVMSLIGETESILNQQNIDSLLYLTLDYSDYIPSESVISELIASGKMDLITSDSLRMLLFDWVSGMGEKDEGYTTMDEISQTQTLAYLTRNGSMKNIDQYGLLKDNGQSKFASRNLLLFSQVEFENHMDNQLWGVTNFLLKLEYLRTIIDQILLETSQSTNKSR
ncbi:DUF6090 family protein [Marinoscillum sp.]|uniref:DUF6090 family protein n=1 Tax=Marinoscillum sp. TaxID=2024838 RepID=UPI003BACF82A